MSNIIKSLRLWTQFSRWHLPRTLLLAVIAGLSPLLLMYLPKLIFDELLGRARPERLALLVGVLAGGSMLFALARAGLRNAQLVSREQVFEGMQQKRMDKADRLTLARSEQKSTLDLAERAAFGLYSLYGVQEGLEPMGGALLSLTLSLGLLAVFDLRLLVLLTVLNALTLPFFLKVRALEVDNARRSAPENRRFGYFLKIATDFRYGKDLRLTRGRGLMLRRARENMDNILRINHEYFTKNGFWSGLAAAVVELQTALAFGLLALRLFAGEVSVGDFVLLYGAARQFCAAGKLLIEQGIMMSASNLELQPYFDYMALEEQPDAGIAPDEEVRLALQRARAGHIEIEGSDLWFTYPTAQAPVLRGCSFVIRPGEILALVGRNGAGKSTLVKLLCRFYEPDRGRLLLNGVDIRRMPLADYYAVLACTFQDFSLLPVRIAENVLCRPGEEISPQDAAAMAQAFERLALSEWMDGLPQGADTHYSRQLDADGVLPSGGQGQKIALARALCHGGGFLMMDEPPAALDPRAEEEVFRVMLGVARGMTALFISHRLSSTRYADRILVMDDGRMAEQGDHDALMRQGGLYARMYTIQAAQYQAQADEESHNASET